MVFWSNSVSLCSIKSYHTVDKQEWYQRSLKISSQNPGFSVTKNLRLSPEFCIRCSTAAYSLRYMKRSNEHGIMMKRFVQMHINWKVLWKRKSFSEDSEGEK